MSAAVPAGGRGRGAGAPKAGAPAANRGAGRAGGGVGAAKPVVKPPWNGPLDAPNKGGGGGTPGAGAENKPPGYVQESLAATLPRFKASPA